MLMLVRSAEAKRNAQRMLEKQVRKGLKPQGSRIIGHPGGSFVDQVYSNGEGALWAALGRTSSKDRVERYWNGFGVFEPGVKRLEIVVETNIPTQRNTGWIAGFFAKDTETGNVYLMHSGKVGGGRPGIGKTAFLAHANEKLEPVQEKPGHQRLGIVIARIGARDLVSRLWRYVEKVKHFKDAADAGKLSTTAFRRKVEAVDRYIREFSGRKSGSSGGTFDYYTDHGDIVEALREEQKGMGKTAHNTPLIDLYVGPHYAMAAVYEVKTSTERQVLYKAIGQLLTHSLGNPRIEKILAVPAGGAIADDLRAAIRKLNIRIRRFTLSGPPQKRKVELHR
ncbi:MAG TPA: hypothetical protein VG387_05885 [Rhizomicrobium sp.]|jgi:hypothetical protein|nr:hypothetical protein [Rhizomicrobium sp.]